MYFSGLSSHPPSVLEALHDTFTSPSQFDAGQSLTPETGMIRSPNLFCALLFLSETKTERMKIHF